MPVITLMPSGLKIIAEEGESIFTAATRAGVAVPTACAGKGTCGLCRVKLIEGAEHLTELNAVEKKHLGNTYFITRLRLSCQTRLLGGDVTVRLPDAPRR